MENSIPSFEAPKFRQLYDELKAEYKGDFTSKKVEPLLTLSVQGMPLISFLRWLSDKGNVSVVAEKRLDNQIISIDIRSEPVSKILSMVGRRLSVEVSRSGNLYFIGRLKPSDRGVLVRKVRRLDKDGLKLSAEVLLSKVGRVVSFSDGLLVVGDRVDVLHRISELLDSIERAPAPVWVVQLFILSVTEAARKELGIQTETTGEIGLSFATGGGSSNTLSAFKGLIKASVSNDNNRYSSFPTFLLLDGSKSRFQIGGVIPVPKRSVSDQGTVKTLDFENVETGTIVDVSLREVSTDRARLQLSVSVVGVVGFVESAPILKKSSFSGDVVLRSRGVYLVGSMSSMDVQQGRAGEFFPTVRKRSRNKGEWQIWATVYRVASPVQQVFTGPAEPELDIKPQGKADISALFFDD